MGSKPTIAISHLGCEKNRIDSEHMLGLLALQGYQIDSTEELADYVIVNTCSFLQEARQESVRALLELAEAKKKIIISGCVAQHFQAELLNEIPEAVAVIGTGDYQKIDDVIQRVETGEKVKEVSIAPTFIADETVPRYRTTPEGVAYLRVAEGCDYRCAFCIIPHLRGSQRSRSIESIVAEAEQLASQRVQELILISQSTTNYGLDLYGEPKLAQLLRALGTVDIPWIRIHYAYPTGLTHEVIDAIEDTQNVLPYIDLPLQHSHKAILKAMNRPGQENDSIINLLRESISEAVLRTTFIVGFPGETEEHFNHLVDFVEYHEFDHVGVFTFSPEEKTPAYQMSHQVLPEIAQQRREILMQVQQPISRKKNQYCVGKIVDVLIEQENPKTKEKIGRSSRFSPEVDGLIYVQGEAPLNEIVSVKITDADTYDLYGRVVQQHDVLEINS